MPISSKPSSSWYEFRNKETKKTFRYAFKYCEAKANANKVDFIVDYCPASVFTGMIKPDDSDDYDNVGEFNSFKFNVFKFPDEPSGMTLHK